jgi:hypothetical protein
MILEALDVSFVKLGLQEGDLLSKIEEMRSTKTEMDLLSKLMHSLAIGKKSKEGVVADEELCKMIAYVHRCDPSIFDPFISKFPEGLLSKPIKGGLEDCLDGMPLSVMEIKPIPAGDIEPLSRRLMQSYDMRGTELSTQASAIQMVYGDQGEIAEIMRDMLDQNKSLLELINGNSRKTS